MLKLSLLGLLCAIGVGIMLYYGTLRRLTKPLDEINAGVLRIAQGDYEVKLPTYNEVEFDLLAKNFNMMVTKQRQYIEGLRIKNAELQAIFDSVRAGIAFLDENQEIRLYNGLFAQVLQLVDGEYGGKKYFEVFHKTEFLEQIQQGFDDMLYTSTEMVLTTGKEDVVVKVTTAPIHDATCDCNTGLLVMVEDITQLKKLENIRREFVANVSHELKTPLTSIRGFIDTLQDGALEEPVVAKKFLNIIDEEAGRLYRMIEQLLYLSQLENTFPTGLQENIDLQVVADMMGTRFSRQLADKSLVLSVEIGQETLCQGDKDTLQQVIINLLDNAIKYSDNGEINLRFMLEDERLICSVQDQGMGISSEEQKRIFERFYRVEKSRAQKNGGTGLGLAIVKHLIENAHGSIALESRLGEGSLFTVTMPVKNRHQKA